MNDSKSAITLGTRWRLTDLLPNGIGQLEDNLEQVEADVKAIEAYRPRLSDSLPKTDFLDLLHRLEALRESLASVAGFSFLSYAENTQSPQALSLHDRINRLLYSIENRTMFFSLWFKALPDEVASELIAGSGDLGYFLSSLRRFKPYTLTEPEEKIINLKDSTGSDALVKIYEIFTNGFNFSLEVDGESKKLTRDGLIQYYRHPSPQVRAATYQELLRVYFDNKTVLSQIYTYIVRNWATEGLELRGYASPISVRNLNNDIPDQVIDILLDVCRKNIGLFQRYFRLKARLLGMEKLKRYDIYAPITKAEKSIDYEEAISLVLDCFNQFSPRMSHAASTVIERSHLDAEIRPGKRGGAFSYCPSPRFVPWVLVNFNQSIRAVTTLAHELGHSVHAVLASTHSILTFHAPLPLSETASVFAEMLVTNRLLQQEKDRLVQTDLLVTILDDAYATVGRQAFISIFERDAHAKIAQGATSDELANLYMHNLHEQFGQSLELSDDFAWEWLTIPHIYSTPFYPYSYSFGQLLVLALYQQYLAAPDVFVPGYIKLLSYGGSAEPKSILADAGLDIFSIEFWQGGFDILQSKLEQLEQVTGVN